MGKDTTQVIELEQLGIRVFYDAPISKDIADEGERASYIHKHAFYELHIMLEAGCTMRADGVLYGLDAGQFCLVAPGVIHTPKKNDDRFRRICISFELMSKKKPVAQWMEEQTKRMPVWVGRAENMMPTVQELQEEAERHLLFSGEYNQALLTRLMLQLVRAMEPRCSGAHSVKTDLDKTRSVLIDAFFNDNYYLPAGEERLAAELGVSRRQLDRILKKLYGKGFQEKVLEIRIEVACDLLQHSDKTIREISEGVGYSTPSNFTAFFKNTMGVTPTRYRRQCNEE